MIRGYFLTKGGRKRPYVTASVSFPSLGKSLQVSLLVDSGADSTLLAPRDAQRLEIDLSSLPLGQPATGVGGTINTYTIEASLTVDAFTTTLTLRILEPRPQIRRVPSLLGRDILSHFALFLDERSERVLLLEPEEADQLHFP